ncbi:hypothetical protein HG531_005239 [Fusarium graminearum]|nr:hypothetical protein HG531_005239 [Fusarium graminearum]
MFLLPDSVIVLCNLLPGDAECSETFTSKHLKVLRGGLSELFLLPTLETGVDNTVRTLAEEDNSTIGHPHDRTHSLSTGVEFDRVQNLIMAVLAHDV